MDAGGIGGQTAVEDHLTEAKDEDSIGHVIAVASIAGLAIGGLVYAILKLRRQ